MNACEKSLWRPSRLPLLLALGVVVLPACRPSQDEGDAGVEEDSIPGEVGLAALDEWQATLEGGAADSVGGGLQVVVENDGLHVSGGPGGMLWRDADLATSGDFRWSADLTSMGSGDVGLLVGGKNLTFPDREYTSFLLRPGGEYRIERREGSEVTVLVDWTPVLATATSGTRADTGRATSGGSQTYGAATGRASTAAPADVAPTPRATTTAPAPPVLGPATGTASAPSTTAGSTSLGVTVEGEDVLFRVDGTVVKVLPASEVEPYGLVGLRLGAGSTAVVKQALLDGLSRADTGRR